MRIIRRLGGPQVLHELREGFASGTLYLVVFLGLFVLEFVGLLELYFEYDVSGFLANAFLSSKTRKPVEPAGSGGLHETSAELERLAEEQRRATAVLRARIAELESPA